LLFCSYTLKILQDISRDGSTAKDKDIIEWANKKLQDGGKSSKIASFKVKIK